MEENKFYTVRGYQLMDQQRNGLTPSLEDYLEMIYRNILSAGYVRVNMLAQELNVKPSSVSKMIMKLAEQGYIDYEKYGVIKLTKRGQEMGKYLLWRHNVINRFFSLLSSMNQENFEEVELVEHILGQETVRSIERLLGILQSEPKVLEKIKNLE
ncbi:MAG: DtxR family transcriptional regulator [Clostridiales bacterium]|nr:DtxR family transcriptional regulator [Clostridiales bacterium]